MRLKLTLTERGQPARDILVTVDVTATVQQLANHLKSADPLQHEGSLEGETNLSLRVEYPGRLGSRALSPLLSVHESGLRSGCSIEIISLGERHLGDQCDDSVGTLHVVAGPDAGARFAVSAGWSVIGRDPDADIPLTDTLVSRRHASITVGDTAEIADLNSANGVEIDGRAVVRAAVTPSSRIRIGEDELRWIPAVDENRSPHRPQPTSAATDFSFIRSPRVEPVYRGSAVDLPQPPGTVDKTRFPMLAMVAPLGMGVALFAVTQQLISLLFIALSPIIMIGTWLENRIQNRRKKRDSDANFRGSLESARVSLTSERERERAARLTESPSTHEVLDSIRARTPGLWTRKPEHASFLDVRFGVGQLPSRTSVVTPSRGSSAPGDWDALTTFAEQFGDLDGVPVVENLERAGGIGVAGASTLAGDIARAIVVQLSGMHSPAELALAAFEMGSQSAEWTWLKWLPHVDSALSPLKGGSLAGDNRTANVLMAELEELIDRRRATGAGRGASVRSRLAPDTRLDAAHNASVDRLPAIPAVVVIVSSADTLDRGRLVSIAETGPDFGVFLLWVAKDAAQLPVACRTFVEVDASGRSVVGYVRTGRRVPLTAVEALDELSAQRAARLLAPIEDAGAPVLDESDLPRQVSLLDLFDDPVAEDADAIIRRWRATDSVMEHWSPGEQRVPGGLAALVGQSASSALRLDLRSHGPHALVGGTTGSGKSEFLQTWILSLATEYSPDRLTFLLVDYKGGSAFADCVDLPHSVGLVTDLTPRLVRRVLTSLRAELRHREALLNRTGAKDLETLERRSDPDAPPSLVIVIDEFAALATEVPEFVAGIIDVAQRGRSLGLHVIMATQRPAGVITESLRANTNLRVALRVADEADSIDVLGTRAAAHFDPGTPGRAAAKLGPGRVRDFQSAFSGGWAHDLRSEPEIAVADFEFASGADWPQAGVVRAQAGMRDSERLVSAIAQASERARSRGPRRPWLDVLSETVDLESLPAADGDSISIAIVDEPESQSQYPFVLRPDREGNVAVVGTSGSGKTTLLRSIAFAASRSADAHPVWIYGLDFAGRSLRRLEGLPTVGSIIAGDDEERLERLVRRLDEIAEDRAERFAAVGAASLTDFRRITGEAEPRILVLIDSIGAFRADYEFRSAGSVYDDLLRLIARGRQVGIAFIVTADRPGAIPIAMQANVQLSITLRLAGDGEYSAAGINAEIFDGAPAGRGMSGGRELQIGAPGGTADTAVHVERIALLASALEGRVESAPPIARLPRCIPSTDLPATDGDRVVIGLGHKTLKPVSISLDGIFVVTGPPGSGRSTAMRTIVRNARSARPAAAFHLLSVRQGELADEPHWGESAVSPGSARAVSERLVGLFEGDEPVSGTDIVIVIEGATDFEGDADSATARLIGVARRSGAVVIAETDTVTGSGAWAVHGQLKAARSGIALQPDEADGIGLFRVQFPRVRRSEFPVGRGILVTDGHISRVQVGLSER